MRGGQGEISKLKTQTSKARGPRGNLKAQTSNLKCEGARGKPQNSNLKPQREKDMAKKKKTMVMMPGGLSDLAHSVQRGAGSAPAANIEETDADNETAENEETVQQMENGSTAARTAGPDTYRQPEPMRQNAAYEPAPRDAQQPAQTNQFGHVSPKQEAADGKDRTAPAAKKLPKAEGRQLAREYSMAKDSGEDSWQIFLDLARDYKARDSRLATVYIDSDLKGVLDRLKSATSVKLPSTALLSAIVARFVFEHEKDIKNAIFGESLL